MKKLLAVIAILGLFSTAYAQTGTIKGTIKTSDQQPAAFVNVWLEGTNKGVSTDAQGEYELRNVKEGSYTLIASYVGLKKKEVEVSVTRGETTVVPALSLEVDSEQLQEVVVQSDKFNRFVQLKTEYVAKLPLENIENPQVYNTISSELLKEQVVTSFDDALKNAPGVEKLWESTGRGGDGAGYFSLRGFAVQPAITNGLLGLTNGSLDPANIERIEVIKGPSGTLYGSSLISYGGLINVVTKKPYYTFGGEITYTAGSFGLNRIVADINAPLSKEKNVAARVITAYHYENSFQDAGFRRSFFIAPSLSYQVNDRLSFLVNTEFISSEGTNPTMLFLYRSAPLEYEDMEDLNYNPDLSLTSNDITIKNPKYNLQAQMNYKISEQWTSQTAITRGLAKSDGYYTYLWDNYLENRDFSLFVSDQNSSTASTDIQQNFIGDFNIGRLRNRMVVGFDYFHRNVIDNSSGYKILHNISAQGDDINYVDPYTGDTFAPHYLSRQSVDALLEDSPRNNSNSKEEIYSAYVSDVINFTSGLSLMASLRLDYFDTEGDIKTDEDDYDQVALSPKFGLVYQPIPEKLSLFANYMNGFSNVAPAPVYDDEGENILGTQTFEPEQANQMEFGIKTNLFSDKLVSTISFYDIQVYNRVFANAANPSNSVQGGEVESKGIEIDVNANPVSGLNIIAGYSYNDSKVTDGDAISSFAEEGKRPGEAGPKNMFNGWASYRFTKGALQGFGLGFGANVAGERIVLDSDATGLFTLPGYTLFGATAYYNTDDYRLALKVDNLTNEEYYKGWSTINPQEPRSVSASFTYKF